ncbi:hypothetical protein TNCV_2537931 [Trichonephila clavipes]|nr:hypothetical protein TNCV_2537931 [Trichonephila clavipes]
MHLKNHNYCIYSNLNEKKCDGQISLIPTSSLCSLIIHLFLRPSRKAKFGSPKKSILLYSLLGKSCTLQRISAHVDIGGDEIADPLANEARTLEKSMKILPDGSRSYVECRNWPVSAPLALQLDPKHLFSCPSIVGDFFKTA